MNLPALIIYSPPENLFVSLLKDFLAIYGVKTDVASSKFPSYASIVAGPSSSGSSQEVSLEFYYYNSQRQQALPLPLIDRSDSSFPLPKSLSSLQSSSSFLLLEDVNLLHGLSSLLLQSLQAVQLEQQQSFVFRALSPLSHPAPPSTPSLPSSSNVKCYGPLPFINVTLSGSAENFIFSPASSSLSLLNGLLPNHTVSIVTFFSDLATVAKEKKEHFFSSLFSLSPIPPAAPKDDQSAPTTEGILLTIQMYVIQRDENIMLLLEGDSFLNVQNLRKLKPFLSNNSSTNLELLQKAYTSLNAKLVQLFASISDTVFFPIIESSVRFERFFVHVASVLSPPPSSSSLLSSSLFPPNVLIVKEAKLNDPISSVSSLTASTTVNSSIVLPSSGPSPTSTTPSLSDLFSTFSISTRTHPHTFITPTTATTPSSLNFNQVLDELFVGHGVPRRLTVSQVNSLLFSTLPTVLSYVNSSSSLFYPLSLTSALSTSAPYHRALVTLAMDRVLFKFSLISGGNKNSRVPNMIPTALTLSEPSSSKHSFSLYIPSWPEIETLCNHWWWSEIENLIGLGKLGDHRYFSAKDQQEPRSDGTESSVHANFLYFLVLSLRERIFPQSPPPPSLSQPPLSYSPDYSSNYNFQHDHPSFHHHQAQFYKN